MNYQQAIDFIQSFPDSERGLPAGKPFTGLKMPLSTMKAFLQTLGNPQNAAKTIHITGSKGKGSTSTFITSLLKQGGLRTALFTSPHMHSYTERIAFDLQPVSEKMFVDGVADLKPFIENFARQGNMVSTFGILTALFFHLVKSSNPPIQWQVVEVGLGGKDDVTNVFDKKAAVVITPISLEHTAILGSTRSAIAENKAGIITPGCLVVLAPQPDEEVVNVIRKICAQKEAQLILVGAEAPAASFRMRADKSRPYMPLRPLCPPNQLPYPIQLQGEHQISNAMTALAAVEALADRKEFSLSQEAIKQGLANAFLPGRFEVFGPTSLSRSSTATGGEHGRMGSAPTGSANSFVSSLAQHAIVLDGAHNGDSALALTKTLHQVFPERDVVFIIGTNQDKDLEAIWLALKDNASAVVATRSASHRSLTPQEVHDRIRTCDASVQIVCADNIDDALTKAQELANNNRRHANDNSAACDEPVICICGSLYLVAEARERLL